MKSEINFIEKKIEGTILKYNMLENVECVIVGVSGGADSMAILKFFEEYSKKNNLDIIAAHINHCLRGKESDRDENFVREYCKKNNIKLEVLRLNVKKIAQTSKKGIEECARDLRYDFFYELSVKYHGKIATAHTLSDSIETMLINLSRGTGINGLGGIPAKRDKIIRPLISLKREETQSYCEENNINYVVDSTNLKKDYTRNKIRLDVIPLLKQINPEFESAVSRTLLLLRSDDEYLNHTAEKILNESYISDGTYDLNIIKNEPFSILSRFIRLAVFKFLKSNVTAQHIELILKLIGNDNGAVTLPQKIKVSVKNSILSIEKIEKNLVKNTITFPFKIGSVLTENSEKFIIKVLKKFESDKLNNLPFLYVMDYDKISPEAIFRTRKPGDKFCQAGRGVTKSVKKLFNELKIPQAERDNVLLLVDQDKVLWINNIGVSEYVKATENTEKFVIIYPEKKNKL